MSHEELDIIKSLSASSAQPRPEFRAGLRRKLIEREKQLTSKERKWRFAMSYQKIGLVVAGLVLAVGTAVWFSRGGDQPVQQENQQVVNEEAINEEVPSSDSTSLSSSLPTLPINDLEAAKSTLPFKPYVPGIHIAEEILESASLDPGTDGVGGKDALYLIYVGGGNGTLYRIAETNQNSVYDPSSEVVTINFNGSNVQGGYYELEEFTPGSVTTSGNGAASPRSYVFWKVGEVTYEISEFGELSKAQLIQLAESMVEY